MHLSDLLLQTIEYFLLPKRRSQSALAKVLPRKASSAHQVMYAVGGMRRREALKSAEKFDVKEGRWKTIGEVDFKNASDSLSNILIGGRYELATSICWQ